MKSPNVRPHPPARRPPRRPRAAAGVLACACLAAGCAGGPTPGGAPAATEAEWRALGSPRPEPLPGAPTLAVGPIQLLGDFPWPEGGVSAPLALSELVATGLLRRRDVVFVERRRFAVAVEAERAGRRPPGQPPAGVSRSAEFQLQAVWIPTDTRATVEVRLVRSEDGLVAAAGRRDLSGETDAVGLAREVVAGGVALLEEIGRRPAWDDPLDGVNDRASSGVGSDALEHFLDGLAAEDLWRWEEARRGYQAAASDASFYEAREALARTARLRLGGTLAES